MKQLTPILLLLLLVGWNIQAQQVSTLAGSGHIGSKDRTGIAASFFFPYGVAVDATGNVYVTDNGNYNIRKVTPEGVVSTLAGSGTRGTTDGFSIVASFDNPRSAAVDASGNVYVVEYNKNKIRKISPTGMVTTFAGSGSVGGIDGAGTVASFNSPSGVAVDASGNVYVADAGNKKIRKISPTGIVSTFVGLGKGLNIPMGVAVDASGNVYVADYGNNKIRKVTPSGVVSTLAGSGSLGTEDGIGTAASFHLPRCVAVDIYGDVYVLDGSRKIRKITLEKDVTSSLKDQYVDVGNVSIYPNPTTGTIHISSSNAVVENVTLTNTLGRSEEYASAESITSTLKGLIMVKVKTNKGTYVNKVVFE